MEKIKVPFKISTGHIFTVEVMNEQQAIHKVRSYLVRNAGLSALEALAVVYHNKLHCKLQYFQNNIVVANLHLCNATTKLQGRNLEINI